MFFFGDLFAIRDLCAARLVCFSIACNDFEFPNERKPVERAWTRNLSFRGSENIFLRSLRQKLREYEI